MLELTCGRARCAILDVGSFAMDAEVLFPSAPPAERDAALARHGLPRRGMRFRLQALLIEREGRRTLVDAAGLDGSGALQHALREAGVDPASIETVVVTHAHLDHYAACMDARGGPGFPQATLVVQRREWEHWSAAPNPEPEHARNFAERLAPLRERVRLVDGDCPIAPGIDAVLTAGHSPGHMAVSIDASALHLGDVIQSVVQVEHPDWAARYDVWPDQVVSTRRRVLELLAAGGALAIAPHLSSPVGRVERTPEGYRWVPARR